MLVNYIISAQSGDKESMLFLIEKFKPLLIHSANKLHYEDAMNDLQLSFIEGINKIDVNKLRSVNDGAITNYIVKIVRHAASHYSYKYNHQSIMLLLSEQANGFVKECYEHSDPSSSFPLASREGLTAREQQVLLAVYVYGYSVSQFAAIQGVSRQNINQIKNRAIRKLRHILDQKDVLTATKKEGKHFNGADLQCKCNSKRK